uniref:Type-4 uracil-DNA glycosylase n=1 Tax=Candidatus Kentrum sp. LFY TaxID=2126342 RepID=A0A450V8Q2_9GAMM|nr:MAG: DNA polymerase [Candidatus Kentron sp. LFY]VFK01136.1 MAG: DNA polymerase [Candidatus Kentron sp. LFY]VFK21232.1 MAG: DNA polymerase [Candidatus Kentron sp. LFY]
MNNVRFCRMSQKKLYYLDNLGISAWKLRAANSVAEGTCSFRTTIPGSASDTRYSESSGDRLDSTQTTYHSPSQSDCNSPSIPKHSPLDTTTVGIGWESLRTEVSACTACELYKTRIQTVFGVGSSTADWMFIGEAPGADEDRQGEPFVGRAGRLLNAMIEAIGLKREEVYIANILKCRPPNNREPKPSEALSCESFLLRQIALVNPKIILAVGRIAAQNLLATTTPIGRMRGRRFAFRNTGIPLIVTYHPAYLLRSPLQKRRSWEDLLLARAVRAETPR